MSGGLNRGDGPAFTPGPWLVHATNRLVCQADGALKSVKVKNGKVVGDDLPNNVCLLRDPGEDFSEDETLANGFLIAAAPELYEALGRAVKKLRVATIAGGTDEEFADIMLAQFNDVLAKARGSTPPQANNQ